MRSVLIEAKQVVRCEISVSEAELNEQKKNFEAMLKRMYPCLTSQSVAIITMSHKSTPEGLIIEAFLEEGPQLSLQLSSSRSLALRGLQNDRFQQRLQRLEHEKAYLKIEQARAADTTRFAEQVIAGKPLSEREIELRKLTRELSKGNGRLIGWGAEERTYSLPFTLPISESTMISARVDAIKANRASLFQVEEDALHERTSSRALPRRIWLERPRGENFSEYGQRLLYAMDGKQRIRARVNICFDGITGQVKYLELVQMH